MNDMHSLVHDGLLTQKKRRDLEILGSFPGPGGEYALVGTNYSAHYAFSPSPPKTWLLLQLYSPPSCFSSSTASPSLLGPHANVFVPMSQITTLCLHIAFLVSLPSHFQFYPACSSHHPIHLFPHSGFFPSFHICHPHFSPISISLPGFSFNIVPSKSPCSASSSTPPTACSLTDLFPLSPTTFPSQCWLSDSVFTQLIPVSCAPSY